MSTICRFGVSWTARNLPARCRPCWMFVKCGGICSSLMRGSLMSALSRTTGSKIVTGLGISAGDFGESPRLGEGVHLDELQEIARIFAANQAVEGQAHALDVDV